MELQILQFRVRVQARYPVRVQGWFGIGERGQSRLSIELDVERLGDSALASVDLCLDGVVDRRSPVS